MRVLFLAALAAALAAAAWADSTGNAPRGRGREWRDREGRLTKRVDTGGRMTLFTYDREGRLARIDEPVLPVDPRRTAGALPGETLVHLFLWGDRGLEGEIDCSGRMHAFAAPPSIDLQRGTALPDHRHPISAEVARKQRTGPVRFEYEGHGRILPGGIK